MAGRPLDIVLLGAPGSGKGTQSARIAPAFCLTHISTGEILRAAVKAGTALGIAASESMKTGELAPDEIVIGIIRERLAEPDTATGFMLDGFPRTLDQAVALDDMLADADRALTLVLLIDVPERELVQRLADRRTCRRAGAATTWSSIRPRSPACATPAAASSTSATTTTKRSCATGCRSTCARRRR